MGELSPWHWAIVILIAVLLFGSRRLPDAARSLGRSARILKAELREGSAPPPASGEAPYGEQRDRPAQRDETTAPAPPPSVDPPRAATAPDARPHAEMRDASAATAAPGEPVRSEDRS